MQSYKLFFKSPNLFSKFLDFLFQFNFAQNHSWFLNASAKLQPFLKIAMVLQEKK
jgi:hypothetical protein